MGGNLEIEYLRGLGAKSGKEEWGRWGGGRWDEGWGVWGAGRWKAGCSQRTHAV